MKFSRAFRAEEFPFMVVGAFAVMAHGAPRSSGDIDFVVNVPFAERARVHAVLVREGVGGIEERKDEWGQRLAGDLEDGLELEVFFTPPRPPYDEEYRRRVEVEVKGQTIPFLSPEDLVLRKLVNTKLRRGYDYDDVVSVLATQGPRFDHAYVRARCAAYRVLFDRAVKDAEAGAAA